VNPNNSLIVVLLIVTGIINGAVAISLWGRRHAPGAVCLGAMLAACTEWCFASALEYAVHTQVWMIWASKLQYVGIFALCPLLVLFSLALAGKKRIIHRSVLIGLWGIPAITVFLAFTNDYHGLIWTGFSQTAGNERLIYHHGVWFWIGTAYSYLCLLAGSVQIVRNIFRDASFGKVQASLIVAAVLIPWITNLVYISGLFPIAGIDPTPFAFSISAVLFAISIYRLHLLDMTPLARSQLVDTLVDPVLAINLDGVLFDLNPAAQKLFAVEAADAIAQPITVILPGWGELAEKIIRPPVTGTRVETVAGANQRWFDVQITAITNYRRQLAGWLIVLHDITRQKEAETQAARLAKVVEQAQETIIITDLNGRIEYANPYFEVATGYTRQFAAGKNPRLLKSGRQNRAFYQELWDIITNGKTWQGTFINRRKDGSLYHEAAIIFPITDSNSQIINFAAVKRDITAQVEAERAIQESERRYRLLADNASDVIWTMNLEGRFTYISPSVESLRGYAPDEVLQQRLEDALTPGSAAIACEVFENFLQTIQTNPNQPGATFEFEQTRKDGSSVWTESIISVMADDAGQVIGLLGVTRDIQARKQAETEQRNYTRQQELLNEITQAAIAEMDFRAMVQILADRLGELLGADGCYITLWDEDKQAGIPAAAYGPMHDSYPQPQGHAQPGEPTFTARLHETRQPLIVPDVFASPYISRRLAERYPSHSILGLPLIANERFLGAVLISFHDLHSFANDEVQRGEQAARQVALAILKAQLLAEAERRATEAETLRLAGAAVASTLNQQEAIERVLQELKRVVPYDSASVMLVKQGKLDVVGVNGFAEPEAMLSLSFPILEQALNALVYRQMSPYIVEDIPAIYPDFHHPPGNLVRGWMGVPVIMGKQMLGMLTLDSYQPGTFTSAHARLATAFADQVAIALENSRLFEETQRLAITDALTGLFNRRHFMTIAEREYQRARRYDIPLTIIMLDIDFFKKINDTYGHLAGDQALQDLAHICNEQLRISDTIGRYGGEELIILLPETTAIVAAKVAERLRQKLAECIISTERSSFTITISVGVAELNSQCHRLDDLIDHADQMLYKAKNGGRNQVVVWLTT
jgi:diguanylate cyclase (GGDEF)-like protein/PAS domain S-box-containing protein